MRTPQGDLQRQRGRHAKLRKIGTMVIAPSAGTQLARNQARQRDRQEEISKHQFKTVQVTDHPEMDH